MAEPYAIIGESDFSLKTCFDDQSVLGKVYDATFDEGNMLVVGATGSGKTSFVCQCVQNGFLRADRFFWVTGWRIDAKETGLDRLGVKGSLHHLPRESKTSDVKRFLGNIFVLLQKWHADNPRDRILIVFDDCMKQLMGNDQYTERVGDDHQLYAVD